MASLYNPGFPADTRHSPDELWNRRAVTIEPYQYWGSQAVVLSRKAMEIVLREWEWTQPYDRMLGAIAVRHCGGMLMHTPSLVQQIPIPSSCGTGAHRDCDFDPFFRATGPR